MQKPLLTVNIVTYNHAQYISQCIDSILSQKTNFGFIIRIFDDCSTDGTTEICQKYEDKYPQKVRLYKADHNLGLKNCVLINALRSYENIETPYYLFIEGDDYRLNKNGFQKQIEVLENNQNVVFSASKNYIYLNKQLEGPIPFLNEGIYSKHDFCNFPETLMFTHISSRIVRTKCIEIDKKNPSRYLNDIKQLYSLINKGDFYFCEEPYSVYRITNKGISTGIPVFQRTKGLLDILIDVNTFTKNKFSLNLLNYFVSTVNWYLYQEMTNAVKTEVKTERPKVNKLKELKHYLLPPIFLDFFNLPRDISRKIRSKGKIRRYFLAPIAIDLLNIPRDIIRKIRKYMGNK